MWSHGHRQFWMVTDCDPSRSSQYEWPPLAFYHHKFSWQQIAHATVTASSDGDQSPLSSAELSYVEDGVSMVGFQPSGIIVFLIDGIPST